MTNQERDNRIVQLFGMGFSGPVVGALVGMGRGQAYNAYKRLTGKVPGRPAELSVARIAADVAHKYFDLSTPEGPIGHMLLSLVHCALDGERLRLFTGYDEATVREFMDRCEAVGILDRREGTIYAKWLDHLWAEGKEADAAFEVMLTLDVMLIQGKMYRKPGYAEGDDLWSLTPFPPEEQKRPETTRFHHIEPKTGVDLAYEMIAAGGNPDPSVLASQLKCSLYSAESDLRLAWERHDRMISKLQAVKVAS